jgi:uncharacterized membrane protein YccC
MRRYRLTQADLVGMRFAINVALATTIVWNTLRILGDSNPIWAIASMVAASEPEPEDARRLLRSRLTNVVVGCAAGLIFLVVGGPRNWILPLALAATVLVSTYVVRIKTMWRQAPITAAVVIASALISDSTVIGIIQGLHKVAEVIFGCVTGVTVSVVMSKVWLIRPVTASNGDF